MKDFFAELRRRNVYKVAVAYAVVGWLLVQVATQVFPFFEIPNWAVRLIVLAIVIGFPIALVMAWAFELTPAGIKRTEDVDLADQPPGKSHTWIYIVVGGAAISMALFFLGRYTAGSSGTARQTASAARTEATAVLSAKSIAVLPFENMSEDKANAYFADGIQEEILTRLAKIADLKVISRTSTQQYPERAIAIGARSKDAVHGPSSEENRAVINTIFGEKNRAISTLARLLKTPYGAGAYSTPLTPSLLRLDPLWDPLRDDPAFQKLCRGKSEVKILNHGSRG